MGAFAPKSKVFAWSQRMRNPQGIAMLQSEADTERKLVCDWAFGLEDMPSNTKDRLLKGYMADKDDAVPKLNFVVFCDTIYT